MKHKSWSSFQTVFVSTGDKTLFLSDTIFSRNNNKTKSSKNFRIQKELLVILNFPLRLVITVPWNTEATRELKFQYLYSDLSLLFWVSFPWRFHNFSLY